MDTLSFHPVGSNIEFRTKFKKDITGEIFEVEIVVNKYQTNIIYNIEDEKGKSYIVDGETFNEI